MQVINANLGLQFQDSARIRTSKSQMFLQSSSCRKSKITSHQHPVKHRSSTGHHRIFSAGYPDSTMHNSLILNTIFYCHPSQGGAAFLDTRNHGIPEPMLPVLEQHPSHAVLHLHPWNTCGEKNCSHRTLTYRAGSPGGTVAGQRPDSTCRAGMGGKAAEPRPSRLHMCLVPELLHSSNQSLQQI